MSNNTAEQHVPVVTKKIILKRSHLSDCNETSSLMDTNQNSSLTEEFIDEIKKAKLN